MSKKKEWTKLNLADIQVGTEKTFLPTAPSTNQPDSRNRDFHNAEWRGDRDRDRDRDRSSRGNYGNRNRPQRESKDLPPSAADTNSDWRGGTRKTGENTNQPRRFGGGNDMGRGRGRRDQVRSNNLDDKSDWRNNERKERSDKFQSVPLNTGRRNFNNDSTNEMDDNTDWRKQKKTPSGNAWNSKPSSENTHRFPARSPKPASLPPSLANSKFAQAKGFAAEFLSEASLAADVPVISTRMTYAPPRSSTKQPKSDNEPATTKPAATSENNILEPITAKSKLRKSIGKPTEKPKDKKIVEDFPSLPLAGSKDATRVEDETKTEPKDTKSTIPEKSSKDSKPQNKEKPGKTTPAQSATEQQKKKKGKEVKEAKEVKEVKDVKEGNKPEQKQKQPKKPEDEKKKAQLAFSKAVTNNEPIKALDQIIHGLQDPSLNNLDIDKIGKCLATTIDLSKSIDLNRVLLELSKYQLSNFVDILLPMLNAFEIAKGVQGIIQKIEQEKVPLNSYIESYIVKTNSNKENVLKRFKKYKVQYLYPTTEEEMKLLETEINNNIPLNELDTLLKNKSLISNYTNMRLVVNYVLSNVYFSKLKNKEDAEKVIAELKDNKHFINIIKWLLPADSNACQTIFLPLVVDLWYSFPNKFGILELFKLLNEKKFISSQHLNQWKSDDKTQSKARKEALFKVLDWLSEVETLESRKKRNIEEQGKPTENDESNNEDEDESEDEMPENEYVKDLLAERKPKSNY